MLHLGEANDHLQDRPVGAVTVDDQDALEAVARQRRHHAEAVADQDVPIDVDGAGPGHVVGLEAEGHRRHDQAVRVAPRGALADLAREAQIDVDRQMRPVLLDRREGNQDHPVRPRRLTDLRPLQPLVENVALSHDCSPTSGVTPAGARARAE
jgi:hypothetical protein